MRVAMTTPPLVPGFFEASHRPRFDERETGFHADGFGVTAAKPRWRQPKCLEREQDMPKPRGFGLRLRRAVARLVGTEVVAVEVRGR